MAYPLMMQLMLLLFVIVWAVDAAEDGSKGIKLPLFSGKRESYKLHFFHKLF